MAKAKDLAAGRTAADASASAADTALSEPQAQDVTEAPSRRGRAVRYKATQAMKHVDGEGEEHALSLGDVVAEDDEPLNSQGRNVFVDLHPHLFERS